MAKATAKDVAAIARVDPSTVSRVLNRPSPRHQYDPRTVRRIRAAAQRLGYRPSRTAQALRSGKSFRLGLVVADIANPFFADLAARIERLAAAQHYRLLVCNTDESAERQTAVLQDLISHGVDGLIVAPCGAAGLQSALAAGLHVVTADRPAPGLRLPHVSLDDEAAGRLLGGHLRALGYRRVGVVLPAADHDPSLRHRVAGLAAVVPVAWKLTGTVRHSQLALTESLADRLQTDPVAAVVGLNNQATLHILATVQQLRLAVPREIGLAGIDDFAAAPFLQPAITVVAQPVEEIAARAVELVLADKAPARTILLPPQLVERNSLCKQK